MTSCMVAVILGGNKKKKSECPSLKPKQKIESTKKFPTYVWLELGLALWLLIQHLAKVVAVKMDMC